MHKFGGSSVADADCFRRVASILDAQPSARLGVVLSACRGVTDALLRLVALAEAQDDGYIREIATLRARHAAIAESLLSAESARLYLAAFDRDCHDLEGILHTVKLTRAAASNVSDLIAGYGEIWSTRCSISSCRSARAAADPFQWVDARKVVIVEWGPLGPAIQWQESRKRLGTLVPAEYSGTLIITGFIASDKRGVQTTLGRNGSDFSASIFGALLEAREIHIWTDVDGVLSADPRRVPDATVIDSLSYNEAMELAYFGAKVIHPQTMAPAVGSEIPIWIRNTFAPEKPGTLICARPQSSLPVKGITSIEQVALINLEGAGMIGVPGTAHRLFGALREEGISVILISQGSSEHSICCAIPQEQAERAATIVRRAFERELKEGQIQNVDIDPRAGHSRGRRRWHGRHAGHCRESVQCSRSNARSTCAPSPRAPPSATSPWWSRASMATRALRAVHAGLYLSPHTISIGVIGPGTVGRVLLDQLASQSPRLREQFKLDLRVRGIAQLSAHVARLTAALSLPAGMQQLRAESAARPISSASCEHVHVDYLPHTVLIDCTASGEVAKRYPQWLRRRHPHRHTQQEGQQRATWPSIDALRAARRTGGAHYLYETTVGAGLPVVQTLRDLRETGDEIRSVEGIFSGTLAYLFNIYDGSTPFSRDRARCAATGLHRARSAR